MVCLMQSCVPTLYGLRSQNQYPSLLQNIKKIAKTYRLCLSFLLQMHFLHLLFFIFTVASVASLSFDCNNDFRNQYPRCWLFFIISILYSPVRLVIWIIVLVSKYPVHLRGFMSNPEFIYLSIIHKTFIIVLANTD